jgi:hypothetical protein
MVAVIVSDSVIVTVEAPNCSHNRSVASVVITYVQEVLLVLHMYGKCCGSISV